MNDPTEHHLLNLQALLAAILLAIGVFVLEINFILASLAFSVPVLVTRIIMALTPEPKPVTTGVE